MEYTEVKQHIIKRAVKPFYVFTGEERYIMQEYVKKLVEVSGKSLQHKDSVAECIRNRAQSLFSTSSCFVVYDDKDFTSNEKAWANVEERLGENMLILVMTSIDKRSKFYKQNESRIVSFDHLHAEVLKKYIKSEIDLSNSCMERLIDICENDCGRMFLEIDKLKNYIATIPQDQKFKDGNGVTFNDVIFAEMVRDGAIYTPPKDVIFDFADAVMAYKPVRAFQLLDECIELGEPPLRLLLVIYNNLKWLLQVQSCENTKDLEQTTGLLYWQIRNVKDHCGVYRNGELVFIMRLIHNLEKAIKRGEMDEELAVPYVLVRLFGG